MASELTQQEIDNQIDAAIAFSAEHKSDPIAREVFYNKESRRIVIHFDNGCVFECPVFLLQGVCLLTDEEIAKVQLTPAGWGISWEEKFFVINMRRNDLWTTASAVVFTVTIIGIIRYGGTFFYCS